MELDVSTIAFAGGCVALSSGIGLLWYWRDNRAALPAMWWGSANCALGVGVLCLAFSGPLPPLVGRLIAAFLLSQSSALVWIAARLFNRGAVNPYPPMVAAFVWSLAQAVAASGDDARLAAAAGGAFGAAFTAATAIEFWRGHDEPLQGRKPVVFILALQTVALLLDVCGVLTDHVVAAARLPVGLFGLIHLVGLFYPAGAALSLVVMLRERREAVLAAAALVDPLTGLPNRRAFMEYAQRLLERSGREDSPISLLMFDLDKFKAINDTFGHPIGDEVLRIFSAVISRTLRPADFAGRLGGEEFVALLPGCRLPAAFEAARRVRAEFVRDAEVVKAESVGATVSAGVAETADGAESLAELIARADQALYRAKSLGRNRVVSAPNQARNLRSAPIARGA